MPPGSIRDSSQDHVGAVLVVGGGIAGVQAALDAADAGFHVYLVESGAALGGRMAQLDKTFPTNDCSMCILSPKLVECGRHLDIDILTCTDLIGLEGVPGRFTARVRRRARYVDLTLCTGCGDCEKACPVGGRPRSTSRSEVAPEPRKAISRPYPQAVPNVPAIDRSVCLHLTRGTCGACEKVCAAKAIRFDDQDREEALDVGAVIMAPGAEVFYPAALGVLGHGRFPNVVTSMEFERLLSASGPSAGHTVRPSDGREPQRIAWLQCVGSRTTNPCDQGYCSAVCCMYAIKQAVVAKDHSRDGLEATIFFMDMRTHGKDFERFYERAQKEQGVRFLRSRVHTVLEESDSRDVILRYAAEDASVHEERFDLVVLSVGLQICEQARSLARVADLELDRYGFCASPPFDGVATSRPGVFACGAFTGPKDIPESVMQASAAAARAGALLAPARGTLTKMPELPSERDVGGEPPRIGIFVCHCGSNIGSVVDVPAVVDSARALPHVMLAEANLYTCSQEAQAHIKQAIRAHGLNRVVVAACSPRTHEAIFQQTCREAGLNPDLFEMANIRDQASWVHADQPDAATAKAMALVRMAAAKACLLRPLPRQAFEVTKAALVIGGGAAGMSAALDLAGNGFRVHLVEQSADLGGYARKLRWSLEGGDARALVAALIERVESQPAIVVHKRARIVDTSGFVGNFTTTVETPEGVRELEHGVTLIATGAREHLTTAYAHGTHPRVVTITELEERIGTAAPDLLAAKTVAFIQCVGSREAERPYCSRVCCGHTVKLALRLKQMNPRVTVFVLYRDLRTYGLKEDQYRSARDKGVIFVRYDADAKPQVEPLGRDEDAGLRLTVTDHVLGRPIEILADFLALAVAIEPADNTAVSKLHKVPVNQDGFFLEAHAKLRPVDFATDGVFLCGLAHGPKTLAESITQAQAAAGRAAMVLAEDRIEAPGCVAEVTSASCAGCKLCEALCPAQAIAVDAQEKVAVVNEALCKGCGVCASSCRSGAVTIRGFTDAQLAAMIRNAVMA